MAVQLDQNAGVAQPIHGGLVTGRRQFTRRDLAQWQRGGGAGSLALGAQVHLGDFPQVAGGGAAGHTGVIELLLRCGTGLEQTHCHNEDSCKYQPAYFHDAPIK